MHIYITIFTNIYINEILPKYDKFGDSFSIDIYEVIELVYKVESNSMSYRDVRDIINDSFKLKKPIIELYDEWLKKPKTSLSDITNSIDTVIKSFDKIVIDYKTGKKSVIMFLIGQVLKSLPKGTDGKIIKEELEKRLDFIQ